MRRTLWMVICGRLWKIWTSPLTRTKSSRSKASITSATLSHILASSSPVRSASSNERYSSPLFFCRISLEWTRKAGGDQLVRFEFVDVRRFHCLMGGMGGPVSSLAALAPGVGFHRLGRDVYGPGPMCGLRRLLGLRHGLDLPLGAGNRHAENLLDEAWNWRELLPWW